MPHASTSHALDPAARVAFIGGGNMGGAILGGLIRDGLPARQIQVVEPLAAAREMLVRTHGIVVHEHAGDFLQDADLIVWAVKPQNFAQAAAPVRPHAGKALHLSVMAGIRVAGIAAAIDVAPGSARIVRAMPNTPALIGQGMTGLYAAPGVSAADRARAEAVIRATGDALWVEQESLLEAVTAVSGSGPAYVFYVLEAMQTAGAALGLTPEQARHLAVATFAGSAALARQAADIPLTTLRERVTSKGGTTYAALKTLDDAGVQPAFIRALHAAAARAKELGNL